MEVALLVGRHILFDLLPKRSAGFRHSGIVGCSKARGIGEYENATHSGLSPARYVGG